jgi:hypothetical protein
MKDLRERNRMFDNQGESESKGKESLKRDVLIIQSGETTTLLSVSATVLPSQIVNLVDQILDFVAILTVCPLAIVTNTPFLVIDPDGTALGDSFLGTSLDRLLEEIPRVFSIVNAQTVIQFFKVHAVLQSTIFGKIF